MMIDHKGSRGLGALGSRARGVDERLLETETEEDVLEEGY